MALIFHFFLSFLKVRGCDLYFFILIYSTNKLYSYVIYVQYVFSFNDIIFPLLERIQVKV